MKGIMFTEIVLSNGESILIKGENPEIKAGRLYYYEGRKIKCVAIKVIKLPVKKNWAGATRLFE